jgi:hypothetical protein
MSKSLQPVMEDARKYMLKKYVDPSIADRLKPLEKYYVSGGLIDYSEPAHCHLIMEAFTHDSKQNAKQR